MRRLLTVCVAILISTVFGFSQSGFGGGGGTGGQGRDDHDDSAPIQSGYAVITPAFPTSDLVVFGTFGLRHGSDTTQASIIPPDLTTNAIMFANSGDRLLRNLGVALVNPGVGSVDVTLTLRKDDGTSVNATTITVATHRQIAKLITELFSALPRDITGTLSITATGPISAIGLRFRGSNFSTLQVTNITKFPGPLPIMATGVGGIGAILVPQFAAGGGWVTEILIANIGTNSLTVRLDLFKQDGTPLTAALNRQTGSSFTNLTIPAGGLLSMAPRNTNGDSDF